MSVREMPQRVLYQEIRLAADRMCPDPDCAHPRCLLARVRIAALAEAYPHNFWSTKVLHNIGKHRLARIIRFMNVPPEALARVRERLISDSMRGSRELVRVGEGGPEWVVLATALPHSDS